MRGMSIRRSAAALLALLTALICVTAHARQAGQPPLEAYYIDPCGACQGSASPGCGNCRIEDEIYLRYRTLLNDLGQRGRRILLYNLRRQTEAYAGLEERLRAQGYERFDLPILLIGDAAFRADGSGDEAVRAFLKDGTAPAGLRLSEDQGAVSSAQTDAGKSAIYLFSRYCEDCRLISPWLEEHLPADVELMKFDIGAVETLALEMAVKARYDLSEEEFVVPALVVGDRILLGSDQIREQLEGALAQAVETPREALIGPRD